MYLFLAAVLWWNFEVYYSCWC